MARAVMRLFPGVSLAFGPTIENGFYYDIDSTAPIREEDFPRIEAEMRRSSRRPSRSSASSGRATRRASSCDDLQPGPQGRAHRRRAEEHPTLSFYRQGEFIDLCRGPHIPDAGKIGAFKLLSIAGAYWKNDASRKQLQRLYGTAFFSQKDLDAYLEQVEEAKNRDHRVLGKQLKLFTISQRRRAGADPVDAQGGDRPRLLETSSRTSCSSAATSRSTRRTSAGWSCTAPAATSRTTATSSSRRCSATDAGQLVDAWMRRAAKRGQLDREGGAATLLDGGRRCWAARSGRATEPRRIPPKRRSAALQNAGSDQQEGYLLKPMNCPHHIQIYKAQPRSYRDLPVRLAEFGTVYRFEQSGELSGMTRVRGFTQDDAHLFFTPEQVEDEFRANIDLVLFVLPEPGPDDYRVRLSLRDPEQRQVRRQRRELEQGRSDAAQRARRDRGMNYTAGEGEAAFYGPKIDFVVRDCIGREWQLGTVQLDYNLPERFELEYTGARQPTAPAGDDPPCAVRLDGAVLRHPDRALRRGVPAWLAPEQVRVLPVSEKSNDYARNVEKEFRSGRVPRDRRSTQRQDRQRSARPSSR